jgi:cobalt/nickel transport system permease protein
MHMADALISPAVGGTMWVAAGAVTLYSARGMQRTLDERRVPLMGVLGAFVFAGQMINFTIPGTGSSGHLGGGLLLAILLGSPAAFITIASILTVQALFFADGGLLALGCNIINLGLFPCFVAYPLFYRPVLGRRLTPGRMTLAATVGAVVGLQLGALGVVGEVMASHSSDLPFLKFVMLMLPVHLAIGVVEGLITAAVAGFVWKARPEVVESLWPNGARWQGVRAVIVGLLIAAAVTGGIVSWFASAHPDGLEWAVAGASGTKGIQQPEDPVRVGAQRLQERTSLLPNYDLPRHDTPPTRAADDGAAGNRWGAPDGGTSLAGLAGGAASLVLAMCAGWIFRLRTARHDTSR